MEKKIEEMINPLSAYYRDYNIPMPGFESVEPASLPEPYRHLLVHDADMTGRLTAFHNETIGLRVIEENVLREVLARRIVLFATITGKEVEFGGIIIYLNRFESDVRNLIEEGKIPLGRILVNHQVEFIRSPTHYLKVVADDMIAECLATQAGIELYGRKSKLSNSEGEVLAEIVEVLPPIKEEEEGAPL